MTQHLPPRLFKFLLLLGLTACGGGGGGGATAPLTTQTAQPGVTFALTDAPSDELGVLNVELTRVALVDASGSTLQVFPGPGGGRLPANLLKLRGVSKLLAHLSLPPGDYTQLQLDYVGATATDRAGNALSVSPASGAARSDFVPALTVTGANQLVEIDFDVDASVSNLVPGAGGSLTLDPTLLLEVKTQGAGYAIEDFHGIVATTYANGLDVQVPGGVVRVAVGAGTVIAGPSGLTTGPQGLAGIAAGAEVEVHGSYDIAAGSVSAVAIELEDGLRGMRGPEAQGIVLSLGATDFELLVLERRDAAFPVGSVQRIATDGATRFAYDGYPGVAASFANLAPGQEVRVFGVPNVASGVKLRDTRVAGTVSALGGGSVTLDVTSFERVAVTGRPSLPTQIQVALGSGAPVLSQGARVELEGQFNRTAPGVFDLSAAQTSLQAQEDQIEGTVFRVVASSPLTVELTGNAGALGNPLTLSVLVTGQTTAVERNTQTGVVTAISAADLAAGIQAGRYVELRAKGQANGVTLTATSIRADYR